mmetsp:Transcript_74779/g.161736  ORF Transcript_74779/g.161736 Transcript_74779/m.161736 type:complete len:138 (+) Transcript_74779:152-565(+)
MLSSTAHKKPFDHETDFKKAVVAFEVDKLHADPKTRTKFDELFNSIDPSTAELINAKKVLKQAYSDVSNVSNILKVSDLECDNATDMQLTTERNLVQSNTGRHSSHPNNNFNDALPLEADQSVQRTEEISADNLDGH